MKTVIVIPARYGSTRFPGKPLAIILGKSLLERTWRIANSVRGAEKVYIATDDERIFKHATAFGAELLMTPAECTNGTERVLAALKSTGLRPDIVINLQGDAVLTPPAVLEALIEELIKTTSADIATAATRLNQEQYREILAQKASGQPGGTLVTFDLNGRALYFSRSIIPFVRNASSSVPIYRHIGIYGYRYHALEKYVSLAPSPLELAEGLEQLRALENGMRIQVVPVDYNGRTHWSVDSPEDAKMAESLILREGELVLN
jgi:3-deoxy-manno-octulosonate cytidylyltransferase (CMP-KDO synthetase)